MKTTITTITAGLLVLGGLAWAQMGPGKLSGMMKQHAAADGSETETTKNTSQHPMHRMRGMMGNMMGSMMKHMMGNMMPADTRGDVSFFQSLLQQREQLGLTPEQVQQLQALDHEVRKAQIRHEAEIQVSELDIETLMQADPVDLTQVKGVVQRLESQRAEMRLARLTAIANAKALLTPEQRHMVSSQTATTPPDMTDTMGCPMMGTMMGQQSDT